MDWSHLAMDKDYCPAYEYGNDPAGSITCWKFLD
jgi:hypothetical protein